MSSISAYVRRFSDYTNRKVDRLGQDTFDKKQHYLHVRLANEGKAIVLEAKGDKNDKDVCNIAEFFAMTPFAASELICRMEDALVQMNFDFDKYRDRFFDKKEKTSGQTESVTG